MYKLTLIFLKLLYRIDFMKLPCNINFMQLLYDSYVTVLLLIAGCFQAPEKTALNLKIRLRCLSVYTAMYRVQFHIQCSTYS